MGRIFNRGDVVLCKKYSIEHRVIIGTASGIQIEPYIDDRYFNRKAYISGTYKDVMEKVHGIPYPDEDKYEITFMDDNNTIAWIDGEDLVLVMRNISKN